jgi:hypothetical protein
MAYNSAPLSAIESSISSEMEKSFMKLMRLLALLAASLFAMAAFAQQ